MTSTPAGDSANALTVSQALAKMLRAYGAEYVFTLTGAPQDPLIEMQNHEGVKVVLGRSERSVLAMADAYARVTGKPTFGVVQFGPGSTYLPPSIIDAFWASSPLVSIAAPPTRRRATATSIRNSSRLRCFRPSPSGRATCRSLSALPTWCARRCAHLSAAFLGRLIWASRRIGLARS